MGVQSIQFFCHILFDYEQRNFLGNALWLNLGKLLAQGFEIIYEPLFQLALRSGNNARASETKSAIVSI